MPIGCKVDDKRKAETVPTVMPIGGFLEALHQAGIGLLVSVPSVFIRDYTVQLDRGR